MKGEGHFNRGHAPASENHNHNHREIVTLGVLDGPNRQSPIASVQRTWSTLSQAIPQVHVERILLQRTPIARFESQWNERSLYEDQILCF